MPRETGHVPLYNSKQSIDVGVSLIVVGILAVILNGFSLDYRGPSRPPAVGHGFWCGVVFIVTGGVGIGAKCQSRCKITAFMVMCILSSLFALCLLVIGILRAVLNDSHWDELEHSRVVPFEVMMVVVALVAAVVSIWGSAICCRSMCFCVVQSTYSLQDLHQATQISPLQASQQRTSTNANSAVIYATPTLRQRVGVAASYKNRQSVGLGAALIIVGILAILFHAVSIVTDSPLASVYHGFWCGITFIFTGLTGFCARDKDRRLIKAFMVQCAISAVFSLCLLAFGCAGAGASWAPCYSKYFYICHEIGAATGSVMTALALVAAFLSVWGTSISCSAVEFIKDRTLQALLDGIGNEQLQVRPVQHDEEMEVEMAPRPIVRLTNLSEPTVFIVAASHQQDTVQPGPSGIRRSGSFQTEPSMATAMCDVAPPPYSECVPDKQERTVEK